MSDIDRVDIQNLFQEWICQRLEGVAITSEMQSLKEMCWVGFCLQSVECQG